MSKSVAFGKISGLAGSAKEIEVDLLWRDVAGNSDSIRHLQRFWKLPSTESVSLQMFCTDPTRNRQPDTTIAGDQGARASPAVGADRVPFLIPYR